MFLSSSRNQLTTLPPALSEMPTLQVLHASNNKLVSLPEEIGKLERLMDLVSSSQLKLETPVILSLLIIFALTLIGQIVK